MQFQLINFAGINKHATVETFFLGGVCSSKQDLSDHSQQSSSGFIYPRDLRCNRFALQKLAHAIYREFFSKTKIENFIGKKLDFLRNIPQSMFWSKNKKNRYTPAYHSFNI